MKYITVSNSDYIEITKNWVLHLLSAGVDAEDLIIYTFCKDFFRVGDDRRLEGVRFFELDALALSAKEYCRANDSPFAKLMSLKLDIVMRHLDKGEHFIYSDADVVFLKDVRQEMLGLGELAVQNDSHDLRPDRVLRSSSDWGVLPSPAGDCFCAGLMSFGSYCSMANFQMSVERYSLKEPYNGKDDQLWLHRALKEYPLAAYLLDRREYPNGWWMHHFGGYTQANVGVAKAIHFNYIAGAAAKIKVMNDVGMWKA